MRALHGNSLHARNLHARNLSRRWSGALTALLAVALTAVGVPAPARASDAPSGSFTYAYAENPTPVLDQSTLVRFGVTVPLGNVVVVLTDEKGTYLTECYQGNTCAWLVNPGPGETKTITAVLRTHVDGQLVVMDTTSVSVTDPGYPGDFSYAYADNPSPAVDQSTLVWFGVSEPLNAAVIDIRDESGTFLAECYQRDSCPWLVNPSPGETKTYTATLRVQLNGHWVDHSTRSITVTDPGWTGTITQSVTDPSFVQTGTHTWLHFSTVAPRGSSWVDVFVDGVRQGTCYPNGETTCTADFWVGANEVHVVRADVIPYLVTGPYEVRASTTAVVTSMSPAQFADSLLSDSPPPQLGALLTPQVLEALATFKAAPNTLETCLKIGGVLLGNKKYGSTAPDSTLDCTAIAILAVAVLAAALMSNDVQSVLSAIVDVFVPGYGGGGGGSATDPGDTGGGGTADNTPNGETAWYLGTQSTATIYYVPEAPEYWRDPTLCRVTFADPLTGEEREVRLTAGALLHSLKGHGLAGDNEVGRWEGDTFYPGVTVTVQDDFEFKTEPADYERLIEYVCSALVKGTFDGGGISLENRNNLVYNFKMKDFMGTERTTGLPTKNLSVIVAQDGSISSSYPGRTEFEEIPAPIEGV